MIIIRIIIIIIILISQEEANGSGGDVTGDSILKFLQKLSYYLAETNQNQATFRMLLQCAYVASEISQNEDFAYEFFEQAFDQYDFISNKQQQKTCLYSLIGLLQQCTIFSGENQEAILHRTASYTSKLTKKEDKCYALCACSHLFW